jgi:hypothetical protein
MAYSNRDETLHFADKMEGELLAAGEDAISREGKSTNPSPFKILRI